jgi:hypothetical protein
MRLLLVGSDKVTAIENYYVRYLKESGEHVQFFAAQSIFYDFYLTGTLHKVLFRAGISGIYHRINKQFLDLVAASRPDLIFVFKGMEIFPGSLKKLKQSGIKLVNYNPDNPFLFSGRGSGNKNVTDSIPLYDLHLTYDNDIREQMIRNYKIPTRILPFGFDIDDQLYAACIAQPEINKVCFLGNPDAQRAAFILALAENCPVDVYGQNWTRFPTHKNVTIHAPVYGDELWKTLYRYRVQLNLMRPHNPNSHNMRSFEVPGVGGIGLFPYTNDHATYFNPGAEVFLYRNMDECIKWCHHLLSLDRNEANVIRTAARSKSLQAGYSYRNRALQALQAIKQELL